MEDDIHRREEILLNFFESITKKRENYTIKVLVTSVFWLVFAIFTIGHSENRLKNKNDFDINLLMINNLLQFLIFLVIVLICSVWYK